MHGHKITNQQGLHFLTPTIVGWIDVFSRQSYRDLIISSLQYCQKEKGLNLHAYVIMTNHLHLLASAQEPARLSDILRDFKKYTSSRIIKMAKEEPESRRSWLLHMFAYHAKYNSSNKEYQVWQKGDFPVELNSPSMIYQKMNYLHQNPVRAGWVNESTHYLYSSASNYAEGTGVMEVDMLDLPGSTFGYVHF